MSEGLLAELVLFELPEVLKILAHFEADGPIVILAVDGIGQRLALGMALDADVVGLHEIETRGFTMFAREGCCTCAAPGRGTFRSRRSIP